MNHDLVCVIRICDGSDGEGAEGVLEEFDGINDNARDDADDADDDTDDATREIKFSMIAYDDSIDMRVRPNVRTLTQLQRHNCETQIGRAHV